MSKTVSENTVACTIFPCVFSDHDFVSLNCDLSIIQRKNARKPTERVSLTNKLVSLKRKLVIDSVEKEIEECEARLKALIERELAGAKVRSRAKWIEEGEKPTSFFFSGWRY